MSDDTTPPTDDHTDDAHVSDKTLARLGLTAVPQTLRDRDNQWCCWRYETKTNSRDEPYETKVPLKPFDSAHPYAKPNDPTTWGDFADAVDFHARPSTDTDGVGFMFDHVIVGVDLDDVRYVDPSGDEHIEPVAQEIIDRLDSYTEYSPSGTGYHILVRATLPDGGNKRGLDRTLDMLEAALDDPDDPNVGPDIELYDNKRFFTVSGDHVPGTPDTIEQRNDAVADIHAEYIADETDDANADLSSFDGTSDPATEVTLDDRALVDLASQSNANFARLYRGDTSGYPSQSEADLALCDHLAFWTQKDAYQMDSIFRSSNLMRPKWDEDRGDQTYGERTIEKALNGVRDVYDPNYTTDRDNDPDRDDTTNSGNNGGGNTHETDAATSDDDNAADAEDHAADGRSGPDTTTDDDDSDPDLDADASGGDGGGGPPDGNGNGNGGGGRADPPAPPMGATLLDPTASASRLQFTTDKQGYAWATPDGTKNVTSFLLAIEHVLDHPADGKTMRLHVMPRGEANYALDVEPAVFNEPRDFRAAICTGVTTVFDGGRAELNAIRELFTRIAYPERTGRRQLGIYPDAPGGTELVVPNGTLTAAGWSDDPTYAHVERGVEFERKITLTHDRFPAADYDPDNVTTVANLLPQTRDPERFIPVLGWFYACAFRPYIKALTGEFNHLSVTGDTGAGKSTTLTACSRCFGVGGDPFGLRGTHFEVTANISTSHTLPVLYDEYKPSEIPDHLLDHFHDHFRKSTRGGVEQRGQRDGSTRSYPLDAPLVVSGEAEPQGPAERRRAIMTTFRKTTTDAGTPTEQAFTTLLNHGRDALADHAVAWYLWALDQYDTGAIDAHWTAADARVTDILADAGYADGDLDPLPRQGLQTVVFGIRVFRQFATEMGQSATADGRGVVDADAVAAAITRLAQNLVDGDQRKSHLDVFVELCADAAGEGYLEEDDHFARVYAGTPNEELRLNVRRCYGQVSKFIRDHALAGTDELLTGRQAYHERFADAADDPTSYVTCSSQVTPPINRAVGLDVHKTAKRLDGFNPIAFGSAPPTDPATDDDTDDAGDDDDTSGAATDVVPDDAEGSTADRRRVYAAVVDLYGGHAPVAFESIVDAVERDHGLVYAETSELVEDLVVDGMLIDEGDDRYSPT